MGHTSCSYWLSRIFSHFWRSSIWTILQDHLKQSVMDPPMPWRAQTIIKDPNIRLHWQAFHRSSGEILRRIEEALLWCFLLCIPRLLPTERHHGTVLCFQTHKRHHRWPRYCRQIYAKWSSIMPRRLQNYIGSAAQCWRHACFFGCDEGPLGEMPNLLEWAIPG